MTAAGVRPSVMSDTAKWEAAMTMTEPAGLAGYLPVLGRSHERRLGELGSPRMRPGRR